MSSEPVEVWVCPDCVRERGRTGKSRALLEFDIECDRKTLSQLYLMRSSLVKVHSTEVLNQNKSGEGCHIENKLGEACAL